MVRSLVIGVKENVYISSAVALAILLQVIFPAYPAEHYGADHHPFFP